MEYVAIVLALVLLQYTFFAFMVGNARGKYNVSAPAVTGNEVFERYYRVQQNTLEQLVIFVPAIFLFAVYVDELTAAGLGVVFFIGRLIYYKAYVKAPKSRSVGFVISFLANHILLLGGLIGAIVKLL